MTHVRSWQSGAALLTALMFTAGAAAPLVIQAPAQAQTVTFSDVSSDYWAKGFIQELANRGILSGFPDGSFRPNQPVTRSQFAAMVRQAFRKSPIRPAVSFTDVPETYWAIGAVREAYTTGFMSGFPEGNFLPDANISRSQVLVSLANGMGYAANGSVDGTLQVYSDGSAIQTWARPSIAAATEKKIVVNYPNVQTLNPNRDATRAEVAAVIYQALVNAGQVSAISSPYVVSQSTVGNPSNGGSQAAVQIPAGTTLPMRYEAAEKILISLEEPDPVPVTLTTARDVVSSNGRVLIPANSRVSGELRVVDGGAQFYAQEIVLPDRTRVALSATSQIVRTTEQVRKSANLLEVLAGSVLGAGAAAGVSAVTGDRTITAEEVLGGAGAGALGGLYLGRNEITLISISPDTDLDVTLDAPLVIR
ncbi:MAG: S-layer homology domain-containing protein [Oscillatoriophycideae cyanobacterium NC_groundwater_1537_Pr4_S-0.65um_50_18]|nr:S-layer homology domain-containing protein [Oscillatoriophycideae cyanobacterium NC_groundwater_1537_Pr4_S-0.65um_50_18]